MITLDTKDTLHIRAFVDAKDFVNAGARVIALTELGWTRKEIAHSLGVTPVTLRTWANAAKNTGVHAIFDGLTSKEQILSRTKHYTNHTQISATRRFHPDQKTYLQHLHSTTKSTRSWKHFKNLLTYLLYLRYPISQLSSALNTSNSHISTFINEDLPDFTHEFIHEFHAHAKDPLESKAYAALIQPESYYILTFPSAQKTRSKTTITKFLPPPHTTTLFTTDQFSLLSPQLSMKMFPPLPLSAIIETDTQYLITHHDAVQHLGITNDFKKTFPQKGRHDYRDK